MFNNKPPHKKGRKTYTIFNCQCCSTIYPWLLWNRELGLITGEGEKSWKKEERLGKGKRAESEKHTLSMVNPRFFALSVWEPSIGRADAHIHDKVEFYTTKKNDGQERKTDPDRKALNTIHHHVGRTVGWTGSQGGYADECLRIYVYLDLCLAYLWRWRMRREGQTHILKRTHESLMRMMYVSQSTSCMISIRRLDKTLGTSSMNLERNWSHYLVDSW